MKLFKKIILFLSVFNLSFLPTLQVLAENTSYSMTPFGAPEPTNGLSVKGETNYYKSLGIDGAPANVTQQQIKESLRMGFPEILETQKISNYDELMKTAEGRKALTRQLQQALNLLSQASGQNLLAQFLEIYKTDSSTLKAWNQKQNAGRWSTQVIAEHATVRSLYTVVKNHLQPESIAKAQQLFQEAAKTLSDPKARNLFDIRNGYRTFTPSEGLLNNVTRRGSQMYVKVKDPDTGKRVTFKLDLPTQDQLLKFKVSDLAKDVMSGTFKYSALSGAILTLIHGISYFQLMTDYANNPRVVEDSHEDNLNMLFFTSIATFFLGAQLADWSLYRRNINYARQLVTEKILFTNKPLEAKKAKLTSMANLSYMGLGTGLLASMAVYHGGEHLLSCLPLFNERPIDERPLSMSKKQELAQMCDQAWIDYVLSYGDQFLLMWAALAGAKTIMTLGATSGVAGYRTLKGMANSKDLKGYKEHLKDIKQQRVQYLEVAGKGTNVYSVRAVTSLVLRGGAQLTITIALVYGILWIYQTMASAYTIHRPVTVKHNKLQSSINELKDKNWKIDPNECDENLDNCGAQKYLNDINEYQKSLHDWRNHNFRAVNEAMSNWSEYYAKAMNYYKAAKYFYKDLILQIAERKKQSEAFQPQLSSRNGYQNKNYFDYSTEVLPLFRTSPFFGLTPIEPTLPLILPTDLNWQNNVHAFPTDLLERNNEIYLKTLNTLGQNLKQDFTKFEQRMTPMDKQLMQKVVDQLLAREPDRVLSGYYDFIGLAQKEAELCQIFKASSEQDANNPYGNHIHRCLAYKAYHNISDSDMWGGKLFPFQAGYKKSERDTLTGAKPLPSGNEYLINYDLLFQFKEIDYGWYEEEFLGRRLTSMSEFLILSAACGPEPHESFSKLWWKVGYSPHFTPPKLPLKTQFDICKWYVQKGYRNPEQLWHYIPNNQDSKVYAGLIDFLYQEINDSVIDEKNFDNWWNLNVKPGIEKSIIESSKIFNEKIVQEKLPKALQRDDLSSGLWKYIFAGDPQNLGYFPSIHTEMGFYFNEIFRSMLDTFHVSYRNYEAEASREEVDKYRHFEKLREEFYNNLNKLSSYRSYNLEQLKQIQLDTSLSLNKLRVFFDAIKFGQTIEDLIYTLQVDIEDLESQLSQTDEEWLETDANYTPEVRKELEKQLDSKKSALEKLENGINKDNQPVLQYEYFVDFDIETREPIINPNTGKPLMYSEQQKIPLVVFNQMEFNLWNLTNLLTVVTHIDQIQKEL